MTAHIQARGGRLQKADFELISGLLAKMPETTKNGGKKRYYTKIAKIAGRSIHTVLRIKKCKTFNAYRKLAHADSVRVSEDKVVKPISLPVTANVGSSRNGADKAKQATYPKYEYDMNGIIDKVKRVEQGQQGQLEWMTKDREMFNNHVASVNECLNCHGDTITAILEKIENVETTKGFRVFSVFMIVLNLLLVGVLYKIVFTLLNGIDIPWQMLLK